MRNRQKEDEEVDFSHFLDKKQDKVNSAPENPAITDLTQPVPKKKFSRRTIVLIAILVVLALVQVFVYLNNRPPQPVSKTTNNAN